MTLNTTKEWRALNTTISASDGLSPSPKRTELWIRSSLNLLSIAWKASGSTGKLFAYSIQFITYNQNWIFRWFHMMEAWDINKVNKRRNYRVLVYQDMHRQSLSCSHTSSISSWCIFKLLRTIDQMDTPLEQCTGRKDPSHSIFGLTSKCRCWPFNWNDKNILWHHPCPDASGSFLSSRVKCFNNHNYMLFHPFFSFSFSFW